MGLLRAELTGCPFRPWAAWAQESPGGERSWVGRHRGLGGEEVCGRRPGRQRPGQQRPWAGTGPPQLWACAAREAAEVCLVGGTPQGACSSAPQPPLASLGPRILLAPESLPSDTPASPFVTLLSRPDLLSPPSPSSDPLIIKIFTFYPRPVRTTSVCAPSLRNPHSIFQAPLGLLLF